MTPVTSLQQLLVDLLKPPMKQLAVQPHSRNGWRRFGHTDVVATQPALLQIAQHAQAVIGKVQVPDAKTLEST